MFVSCTSALPIDVRLDGVEPRIDGATHTLPAVEGDPLWLDAQTMRALGRDAVELITARLTRPWDATPVVAALSPEELAARLS